MHQAFVVAAGIGLVAVALAMTLRRIDGSGSDGTHVGPAVDLETFSGRRRTQSTR